MAEEQTHQDALYPDIREQTQSVEGRPEIAEQARAEVPKLEAEEHRLLQQVERLRSELAAAEAEYERVQAANMRTRRAAITGEPKAPREDYLMD